MFRNYNDQKLLTPEKAFGEEALEYLGMTTCATVTAGLVAIGNLGTAVTPLGVPTAIAGGVMHTVAASQANVPLHLAAHTTMKVGGIMVGAGLGAATVSLVASEAVAMSYSDDKSEDKIEHVIPFSQKRAAKYNDNLSTITSIFKEYDTKVIQNSSNKMQSSKKDLQLSI